MGKKKSPIVLQGFKKNKQYPPPTVSSPPNSNSPEKLLYILSAVSSIFLNSYVV